MNNLFFSTAYAADPGGMFNTATLMQFGPIVLIFLVFYFLLIRPQQKRQKELREQQNGLRRGDKVVTAGGIVGVVQATRDEAQEVEVEIAPDVKVKIVRSTISTIIPRDKSTDN